MVRTTAAGTSAGPVVLGVGEPFRGDDGAGPEVVRRLRGRVPSTVRLIERVATPTDLIDRWDGAPLAVLVDAGRSGAPAGSVRRLDLAELAAAPSGGSTSSHGLSVRDAVELGRCLGRLPERFALFLIEVARTGTGQGLSPQVEEGVEEAARRIARELESALAPRSPEA